MNFGHFYSPDYVNHLKEITSSKLITIRNGNFNLNIYYLELEGGFVALNSSPFFNSHGSIFEGDLNLVSKFNSDNFFYNEYCFEDIFKIFDQSKILCMNFVQSPFLSDNEIQMNLNFFISLKKKILFKFNEIKKTGFIKEIVKYSNDEQILETYHPKTRNCIRKFLRSSHEIQIIENRSDKWKKSIEELSLNNGREMSKRNILSKNQQYFQDISRFYNSDRAIIMRIIDSDENLLSSCLFFLFDDTIEYWTPYVSDLGKKQNALHGLIHEVHKYMAIHKLNNLNFGGTDPLNTDLIRFKSRFGSKKMDYSCYNFVNKTLNKEFSINELMREHPYFYFWENK